MGLTKKTWGSFGNSPLIIFPFKFFFSYSNSNVILAILYKLNFECKSGSKSLTRGMVPLGKIIKFFNVHIFSNII